MSYEEFAPGHYLIRARKGETMNLQLPNRYLELGCRMRDLLYTKPELEASFASIFENPDLPLVMEIGCYLGRTVIEIAQRNRDLNVLGVDIRYKRVVKSCQKIQRAQLPNAKIAIGDGRELLTVLPDHSLYGLLAFFPDPWQRKKQKKNRFLDDRLFGLLSQKLTDGGFIWIKTDAEPYFEEIQASAAAHGFTQAKQLPRPLIAEGHRTFFEDLFMSNHLPIYQLFLTKG